MTKQEVCVITHYLSPTRENAGQKSPNILGGLATVSLVTVDLPADFSIRDGRELAKLTRKRTNDSLMVTFTRLLANQIRMYNTIKRRTEETTLFFGDHISSDISAQIHNRNFDIEMAAW